MRLIVTEDHEAMSLAAARLMADAINANPFLSLVFATGNTPLQSYKELARLRQEGQVKTDGVHPFQLDEYKGVPSGDPRSLYDWSKRTFLEPLELSEECIVRLRGDVEDVEAACHVYDKAVAEVGGFDLSILGLGPNGHLGFNEPPTQADDHTRQVTLTQASLVSNAVYWGEANVPREALTCGMNHLLAARQTLLLVSGECKREILWKTIKGPITPEVPSSYLRLVDNVIVITDKAAWSFSSSVEELGVGANGEIHV
jgi:glucosamine-6-phosphate deaminase